MGEPSNPDNTDRSRRLDEILAGYLQQVDAGEAPGEETLLAAHPEFAKELREFLADLRRLQEAAPPAAPACPDAFLAPAFLVENPVAPPPPAEPLAFEPTTPGRPANPAEPQRVRYFGEYELLEEIARGGMGVVWRARQTSLKRPVALKMILAGQFANADDVRRFHAEAQAAARLEHPHIVPIFEIGQHEGQHYFTMALVEGENLARHIARGPLAPRAAAEIMAKVARAIAFAHAEGVVHRDLKPANILLDAAGEPHVTDFGLAKRVAAAAGEETTSPATATGAVLGTPSFMPPEQAAGRNAEVGPLSDVYSLGAVLYALLVGRPPFQAASPLDTLLQVLEAEPVPPRWLNPAVPRDLNTICLKCLAKEPRERYVSAAALADDLERYLRDEPILARPTGPAEHLLRLARKHRRTARLAVVVAAATAVLSIAAWGGWNAWTTSQLGLLLLASDEPQTAELLDDADRPVVPAFAVPMQQPVAVPRGEYRLRLSAPGQLSETWFVGINQRRNEFTLVPSDRRLWQPMNLESESCFGFLTLPDRTDLVVLERRFGKLAMRRFDGRTASLLWETPLDRLHLPARIPDHEPAVNTQPEAENGQAAGLDTPEPAPWAEVIDFMANELERQPPTLLAPAADLDGDKEPDVLWLSRQAHLLAISGKDGRVLWWQDAQRGGTFVGRPVVCLIPGEDHQMLLALVVAQKGFCLDAFHAASGRRIWRATLNSEWLVGNLAADARSPAVGTPALTFPLRVEVVELSGRPSALVATATHLVTLRLGRDAPTPSARRYIEAAALPTELKATAPLWLAPRLLRLKGREHGGEMRLLLCVERNERQAVLCCLNVADWTKVWDWHFALGRPKHAGVAPPESGSLDQNAAEFEDRLLAADLDGDGAAELLVPGEMPSPADTADRGLRAYGVYLLDGATGRPRWQQTLYPAAQRPPHFAQLLLAGDLDADGCQDAVVCSLGQYPDNTGPWALHIDAVSGKDGTLLTHWQRADVGPEGSIGTTDRFHGAAWWEPQADGWPSLVVMTSRQQYPLPRQAALHTISLQMGSETSFLMAVPRLHMADLNGDGLADLCFRRQTPDTDRLHCLAARPAEAWRRLGDLRPICDLDRTSAPLLVQPEPFQLGAAHAVVSGRTGRAISKLRLEPDHGHVRNLTFLPDGLGDLDGDRMPDLIIPINTRATELAVAEGGTVQLPLRAVSFRNSVWLWDRPPAPFDAGFRLVNPNAKRTWASLYEAVPRLADLDGDGSVEVLCPYLVVRPFANQQQPWLAVVEGRSGRVLWNTGVGLPIDERALVYSHSLLAKDYADLNEDGWQDVVVSAPLPRPDEMSAPALGIPCPEAQAQKRPGVLQARSGKDGSLLWSRQLGLHPDSFAAHGPPHKLVADLDDDGRAEIVYLDAGQWSNAWAAAWKLVVLEGHDGAVRWVRDVPGASGNGSPPVPLIARLNQGPQAICVPTLLAEGGLGLEIHSAAGERLRRVPIQSGIDLPLAVADLDGDELDELVYCQDNRLHAGDGGSRLLWQWPEEGWLLLPPELQFLPPAHDGTGPRLLVRSGRTVFVLDAATGRPVWRTEGLPQGEHRFLPDASDTPPMILAKGPYVTVARLFLAVDEFGKMQGVHAKPVSFRPQIDRQRDPRRLVFLSWSAPGVLGVGELAWPSLLLGALVLLPGWALCRLARVCLRLRSLAALLVLIAAAFSWIALLNAVTKAVWLGSLLWSGGLPTLDEAAGLYATGSVLWLLPFLFVLRAAQRRWRAVAWLLGIWAVVGALVLAAAVWEASTRVAPGQAMSWRGWYWAWLVGGMPAALLIFVIWAARRAIRGLAFLCRAPSP